MRRKTQQSDQKTWSQHFRPGRPIREIHEFSREQIERMIKMAAKSTIIGSMYVGDLGAQQRYYGASATKPESHTVAKLPHRKEAD